MKLRHSLLNTTATIAKKIIRVSGHKAAIALISSTFIRVHAPRVF